MWPLTAIATPMASLCFSTRPFNALAQASQTFLTWGESSASLRLELVFADPRRRLAIAFCWATRSQTARCPPRLGVVLAAARTSLPARIVLLVLLNATFPCQ